MSNRSQFSTEFRLQELEGAVQLIYSEVQTLISRVNAIEGEATQQEAPTDNEQAE